tara:strand:- start:68099 stop:68398 length:300 start_codon:yes stop_codon:yes gene_type:complete
MLKKEFTPKRTVCKVTFSIPKEWAEKKVHIVGDFNDWNEHSDSMELKKGKWVKTLRLKPQTTYRFKYLIDQKRWENDDAADSYITNNFGSEDSVLQIGK